MATKKTIVPDATTLLMLSVVKKGKFASGYDVQKMLDQEFGLSQLSFGTIYPALHRLADQKLLIVYKPTTHQKKSLIYYQVSPAGNHLIKTEFVKLQRVVTKMGPIVSLATPVKKRKGRGPDKKPRVRRSAEELKSVPKNPRGNSH
jgi:DNA-binding PadR family transcriptional regulator